MLQKIHEQYWKEGVEVIAINLVGQIPLNTWQDYLNQLGLKNATIAVDTDYAAVKACQIRTAGATIVLNKQGHVIHRDRSASTYEQLNLAVSLAL